jgi:exopolyphosphatase/guanosine-5'-triphosphate,3'-diphosphate pyrophosphatase
MINGMGESRVVAFVDIGTNSIRLLVVRINLNGSYTFLSQEKETVRLGESEFKDNYLIPAAMERAVVVCRKFAELSNYYGAKEIIAVATSAAREAKNQAELLEMIQNDAHIEVSVISGKEEARLIYLGVSSGINIGRRDTLFIDIGGGSCEIMIGNQIGYSYLDSLNLGAIRMTSMFIPDGHKGPVTNEVYNKMRKYVKAAVIRTKKRVEEENIELTIASSGTAINLAQIAARMFNLPPNKQLSLRYSHLKKVVALLCSLPLEKRKEVAGINPERADIIIGGAATLETLMEEFEVDEVIISERGLRDGMLMEHLGRSGLIPESGEMGVRERSVLQLGRSCNLDEVHAERVKALALQLFDSFNNHHLHSHYIISNAEVLGFDQREIAIMANVSKFHRKRVPRKSDPDLEGMDAHSQKVVVVLSTLLRVAESLDRSHTGLIVGAEFVRVEKDRAVLRIRSKQECQLECWGVESDNRAFERAFDRTIQIEVAIEPAD